MSASRLPDFAASRAVLVGCQRYASDRLPELPGVGQNIAALSSVLTDSVLSGFDGAHVARVLDPESIDEVMDPIVRSSQEATDVLLVYFAGHGLLMGPDNALHLTTTRSDTERPWSALPFAYLARTIKESAAATKILLLDCCYSGRASMDVMGEEGSSIADELAVDGIYVMTATSKTKKAKAPIGEDYTAFTGLLVQVMREGIEDADELLPMSDLYGEVLRRTRKTDWPLPQQVNHNNAAVLALVRNASFTPGKAKQIPKLDLSRSQAVLVGVANYREAQFAQLPGSVTDVAKMGAALTNATICGIPAANCYSIIDPPRPEHLLGPLSDAARNAEDVLLFYFSGIGLKDEDGRYMLAMTDSQRDRPWSSLKFDDLAQVMSTRARAVVIIVDSSYSGSILDTLPRARNVYALASSSRLGYAFEYDDSQPAAGGSFTRALLNVLERGIPGAPAHLSIVDVAQAIDREQAQSTPQLAVLGTQHPKCLFMNRSHALNTRIPHACLMTE
ncbi:caspase family protein [Streptomyces sp. NBC_00322]|uniref:caspase, EACC1-associated type n=1 Tax=Streptomyces sp. NBC_00322 TaxID=2975712 RepID=UPI002E28D5E6|nr:caspase family protein [Streptomyces sp. NBC_00322]